MNDAIRKSLEYRRSVIESNQDFCKSAIDGNNAKVKQIRSILQDLYTQHEWNRKELEEINQTLKRLEVKSGTEPEVSPSSGVSPWSIVP